MEKYFKRKSNVLQSQQNDVTKKSRVEINMAELPSDPGKRICITDYDPNIRDEIRRHYLQQGPCQPKKHKFIWTDFGSGSRDWRRFNVAWFDDFPSWLEYSIENDSTYCLCCYLFKPNTGKQAGGQLFVCGKGFSNWKRKDKLYKHVGEQDSSHNDACRNCEALLNEKQHLYNVVHKSNEKDRNIYRIRLTASVDCIRFLLRQGLAFRGHDESDDSPNKGNFLELLSFLADHNEDIDAVVMNNAPDNHKMTSHFIQKDIVNASAVETIKVIMEDMGDAFFSILVDESRDASIKEQMVVMFRYVDKNGCVIERFIGIEHVANTTAASLKLAIDQLFSRHGLSISRLRGQGYDGASNMSGEFNGLKTIIMKDNPCAFYVHCFAHQLQLSLMGVAKKHDLIGTFFTVVSNVVNIVGASSKRRDILRGKHALKVVEALKSGELLSGKGLNQEIGIRRPCDTRWGTHHSTLVSLITMFSSIIDVLEEIADDRLNGDQKYEASIMLGLVQTYDFAFSLHLMKTILGITNELSQVLQRDDQDIVNAMYLVKVCKQQLQTMRESGWDSFVEKVGVFCVGENINVPQMDGIYQPQGRSRRKSHNLTNLHKFRYDFFNAVIDLQLQELNNRFTEANTELLLCLACLSPNLEFSAFDKEKLSRLAELYPLDFSNVELMVLESQLETYVRDMRSNSKFSELKGISDLAQRLVETRKHGVYPLVYLLIKLASTLPVATTSVERAFSAMNIIKNQMRNRMGDEWLNDCLTVYLEKDVFKKIDNEPIIQRFQKMKIRKGHL